MEETRHLHQHGVRRGWSRTLCASSRHILPFFFPPIALRVSSRLFPFGPVFPSRPPSTRNGKRLAMTNNLPFASTAFFHAEDANGTAGTHYANKSFAFIGLTQCTCVCVFVSGRARTGHELDHAVGCYIEGDTTLYGFSWCCWEQKRRLAR